MKYYQTDTVTLYHGDSRDILPDLTALDVLVTDPPYGVNLGQHSGAKEKRVGLLVKSGGYEDSPEYFSEVVVDIIQTAVSMTTRAAVFCVPPSMWQLPAPDTIGGIYVPGAVGRNRWGWSNLIHILLYGTAPDLNLGAKPTAISSSATAEKFDHPTVKPLAWLVWLLNLVSKPGELVIDPFVGSGTTVIAALRMGRRCIGIDISQDYLDITVGRIEQELQQPRLFDQPIPKQDSMW